MTSPSPAWAVRKAMSRIGRPTTESEICDVLSAIAAANGEEDRLDSPGMDSDAALHRSIAIHVYRDAGLEESLCQALYAVDADQSSTSSRTTCTARCKNCASVTSPSL